MTPVVIPLELLIPACATASAGVGWLAKRIHDVEARLAHVERWGSEGWRLLAVEIHRNVALFAAQPPAHPTVPPPPESEPTGVRRMRDVINEQALQEYLDSQRPTLR